MVVFPNHPFLSMLGAQQVVEYHARARSRGDVVYSSSTVPLVEVPSNGKERIPVGIVAEEGSH